MIRVAAGLFLITHALVTGAIWMTPKNSNAQLPGFGSQGSWLFAENRSAVLGFALFGSVAFGLAGVAVLTGSAWWAPVAIPAALASLALITATFTPWWSAAIAINLAIICIAWGTAVTQLFD